MIAQWQILDYLERSGDEAFRWELPVITFQGGWFNHSIDEKTNSLIVHQAYGENRALLREAKALAGALNLDSITFATSHNGEAMARLFKGEVIASVVRIQL